IEKRLRFLTTLAQLWLAAARQDPRLEGVREESQAHGLSPDRVEVFAGWLSAAQNKQEQLLELLDALNACRVPKPSGSPESLLEYDRRRLRKEQVLEAAINTALAMSLAVGALHGATTSEDAPPTLPDAGSPRPPWEPQAIQLEQALVRGEAVVAR